jgi:hypothetical protein
MRGGIDLTHHGRAIMKHVNLDSLDEPVRKLLLAVALEPAGSVLESNGHAVAWVLPADGQNGGADEPWTDARNARRCDLIDRKYGGALTPPEALELAKLQAAMLRHRQRVAPLPLAELRRLHQELLNKEPEGPEAD